MAKYTYNPPYNQWSGNRSDTLNKWKINYKGSIATASALPDKGEFKGDTYNVLEDGSNYMWNGASWDKLDANIYIGATSIKDGIQGLVPPASNSQIYSLLTGGGTWESAEDLGLALDDEVVHLTGDETIEGYKIFKNEKVYSTSGSHVSNISIRNPAVERGTATDLAGGKRVFSSLYFLDSEGSEERPYDGRLAMMEYCAPSTDDLQEYVSLCCYDYFSDNGLSNAVISIGYDTDRIPYATAPETSDDRTNSTDIVTRGYMEASEWNWQKTKKNALVQFKSVPESDLEPVVDFMFTETPPAEGEKGPENPSMITGVASAKVTRCGKNLIPYPPYSSSLPFSLRGVTVTASAEEPGALIVSGTVDGADVNFFALSATKKVPVKTGVTYTASGCPSGGNANTYHAYIDCKRNDGSLMSVWRDTGSGVTFTPSENGYLEYIILIKSGQTVPQSIWRPQIELGSTATAFEPYEGNEYTVNLNGTYYGGSLDVATGVMTVTGVRYEIIPGVVSYSAFDASQHCYMYTPIDVAIPKGRAVGTEVCTHFNFGSEYNGSTIHFYCGSQGTIYFFNPEWTSKSDATAFFNSQNNANTPVVVCYPAASPISTVQLTPTQIRSLPALDKYEPRINTVYTDQKTVQVGYQRYFNESRLAALEARIEALEASQG